MSPMDICQTTELDPSSLIIQRRCSHLAKPMLSQSLWDFSHDPKCHRQAAKSDRRSRERMKNGVAGDGSRTGRGYGKRKFRAVNLGSGFSSSWILACFIIH